MGTKGDTSSEQGVSGGRNQTDSEYTLNVELIKFADTLLVESERKRRIKT